MKRSPHSTDLVDMTRGIDDAGGPPIEPVADIARIRAGLAFDVRGVIGSTRVIRVGRSPAYCCTLVDGTGKIELFFLGHAIVDELRTGASCAVSGRAAMRAGRPVAWNPRYRLDRAPAGRHPDQVRPVDEAGARGPTLVQAAVNVASAARHAREPAEATGRLRIYLGAGVGKTYAMLDEARCRRRRGADVVIAAVEPHGRPATEAQAGGLEAVPRKVVEHHGARLEELDVEAVLARRPEVALVDELAHSNAPGCGRNEKRWQDVLELLAAGIDVITTVNAQHIESLADVVERISGIRIRERVPDVVIRSADRIELVDSSPEQPRRRMSHGDVYAPEQARTALDGFFRTENLAALRELALHLMADETIGELGERRLPGEGAERMLLGVTPAPGADAVLHRAARIAARIRGDLHVAHVVPADARTVDGRVVKLRALAGDLGAQWTDLAGDDPAAALLDFARRHQITQVMVGPGRRGRWRRILGGGSTVRRLSRSAGHAGIDVHIVASPGDADG